MSQPLDAISAVTHPDPYPYYATLTATRPFEYDDRLKLWVAADADAVTEALQSDLCTVRPTAEPVPRHLGGGPAGAVFGQLVRMRDDPAREAVKQALLRQLGALTAADIATAADRVLRSLHKDGCAPDAWPFHLPVRVMAALLGIAPEDQAEAAALTGDFVRCLLPSATPAQVAAGDDAAEALLRLLQDGSADAAPLANALGLLMQTHDATAALLGNALVALQRFPALAARLKADATLAPDFIAEMLRWDAPVQNTRRFVAEDGEIADQPLRAGDTILILLAAANRDPAANADPHRFVIDRKQRRIFGFGHGRHACAGPEIAATIAATGIQYWVNHGLALPEMIGYRPSANARIPYFSAAI